MRQVVFGVDLLEGVEGCNAYLLSGPDGPTLVDTGLARQAEAIIGQLEEAGYALSDLRAIVLTHCHADHAGNVAELAERSGAQVLAHRDEVPFVEGKATLPSASRLMRILSWLSERSSILREQPMFKAPRGKVDRALVDGDVLDALGGLRAVHAPGHTPGTLCLYHAERRTLFCGDALFNANPLTGRPGLRFPLPMATTDIDQARESARMLSEMAVDVLCPGHGKPILEGADKKMRALF